MSQICATCGIEKHNDCFEKQKNRPNPRKTCKTCRYSKRDRQKERERHRAYMRERRKSDPATVRKNWERSVYGAAKEDICIESCMICGSIERLCIDHDHATGEIRGILCSKCNSGLGMFRDSVCLLEKAASYLKDGPHFQLPAAAYPT